MDSNTCLFQFSCANQSRYCFENGIQIGNIMPLHHLVTIGGYAIDVVTEDIELKKSQVKRNLSRSSRNSTQTHFFILTPPPRELSIFALRNQDTTSRDCVLIDIEYRTLLYSCSEKKFLLRSFLSTGGVIHGQKKQTRQSRTKEVLKA